MLKLISARKKTRQGGKKKHMVITVESSTGSYKFFVIRSNDDTSVWYTIMTLCQS